MKPKYDTAVIKIKELEKRIESLQSSAVQHEELEKTLYLQFYAKQEKSEKLLVRTLFMTIIYVADLSVLSHLNSSIFFFAPPVVGIGTDYFAPGRNAEQQERYGRPTERSGGDEKGTGEHQGRPTRGFW